MAETLEPAMDQWWRKYRHRCTHVLLGISLHQWRPFTTIHAQDWHPLGTVDVSACTRCALVRHRRAYGHVEYVREVRTKVPS